MEAPTVGRTERVASGHITPVAVMVAPAVGAGGLPVFPMLKSVQNLNKLQGRYSAHYGFQERRHDWLADWLARCKLL